MRKIVFLRALALVGQWVRLGLRSSDEAMLFDDWDAALCRRDRTHLYFSMDSTIQWDWSTDNNSFSEEVSLIVLVCLFMLCVLQLRILCLTILQHVLRAVLIASGAILRRRGAHKQNTWMP